MMPRLYKYFSLVLFTLLLVSCNKNYLGNKAAAEQNKSTQTDENLGGNYAKIFLADAENTLATMSVQSNLLSWAYETNITPETEKASADYSAKLSAVSVDYAQKAAKIDQAGLSADERRKLLKLRLRSVLAAPSDAALNQELSNLATELNGMYGAGKGLFKGEKKDLGELSAIVDNVKNSPEDRLLAWQAWHEVSKDMKPKFMRLVEVANLGARELNFADTGDLWRSNYDMKAADFSAEVNRLWGQLKPLYDNLHCYVRGRLNAKYGDSIIAKNQAIPAHMLGNMWAQSWNGVYEEVAPNQSNFPQAINVTARLQAKNYDYIKMFETAEGFYKSLGLRALPASFWKNSMFVKPEGREVVCHASAWDIDNKDDVRVKMCTQVNDDDFVTIHHELGHNYYQMAYQNQPLLFQDSANDGFHEAIGDTIALSMTPKYLHQIGLIDQEPSSREENIPFLLNRALEKIAFLPFALVVDQWRWNVFSGEVSPENYNKSWWQLREKYQGVKAADLREEHYFDAGAKYHVAANVPYTRYFLAAVLQFQFYRSMCKDAGQTGPLYRCSFFKSKDAGDRLNKMMQMGASKTWQDALEVMTGSRDMDASAIVDYFAPLQDWLDEQNKSKNYSCGW